ncbi:Rieske (2Fe-2S) protein [Natronococcus wangiae]|uniref:Rieske (2Fe-2S) protein n=1 Tax=Natronococcus wangiae TaxID=3068275 RepID=UPI00273EE7B8|nr:Rieske 2Fe-2S domain-containing protein [Natronococcus sp. AD5]
MAVRHRLTSVETVREDGSWLFTVRDQHGTNEEVILVPCADDGDPVEAWINRCTHEEQRLHRDGVGAVIREGQIVCPKHGSMFDTCSGYCDNGEAAETTLVSVEIAVEDGQVYLTDGSVSFLSEGASSDDGDDDTPGSTSHLQF